MDLIEYARAIERFLSNFRDDLIQHESFPRLYGGTSEVTKLAEEVEVIISNLRFNRQAEERASNNVRMRGLAADHEAQKLAWSSLATNTVTAETFWLRVQKKLLVGTKQVQQQIESGELEALQRASTVMDKKSHTEQELDKLNLIKEWFDTGRSLKQEISEEEAFWSDMRNALDSLIIYSSLGTIDSSGRSSKSNRGEYSKEKSEIEPFHRGIFSSLIEEYGEHYSRALIVTLYVIISLFAAIILFGLLRSTGVMQIIFTGNTGTAEFGGAAAGAIFIMIILFKVGLPDKVSRIKLRGNVVDAEGKFVKGANVNVIGAGLADTITPGNGYFEIELDSRNQRSWILLATYRGKTAEKKINRLNAKNPITLVLRDSKDS